MEYKAKVTYAPVLPSDFSPVAQEQLCKSSLRQAAGVRPIQTGNQLQSGFGTYVAHQCSPGYHGCIHAGSYCPSSFAKMNTAVDHRIHLGDRLESTPEVHFEY